MRLAAYIRRSWESQEDSPETQRRILQEYCKKSGHDLVKVDEEEAISAGVPIEQRPVASALFAEAISKKRTFDGIVVVRLDRLFRDLADQLSWMSVLDKHKCIIHTPSGPVDRSTPEAAFMQSVLGAAAELERKLTGQRMKERNIARALSGKLPCGIPPLGLCYDKEAKTMHPSDRAADAVEVFREYIKHSGNACATCRTLNQRGIYSINNNPWHANSLYSTLRSPYYRQRTQYDGHYAEAPDFVPRVVPKELTDQVDRLLLQVKTIGPRSKGAPWAYTGLLICAGCGRRMVVHSTKHLNGKGGLGWMCQMRYMGACQTRRVAERFIDALVSRALKKLLISCREDIAEARGTPATTVNAERQLKRLADQRERWLLLFTEGKIEYSEVDRRVKRIDEEVNNLKMAKPVVQMPADLITGWLERIDAEWGELPQADKREFLTLIGARIVVYGAKNARLAIELESNLSGEPVREESLQPKRLGTTKCVYVQS